MNIIKLIPYLLNKITKVETGLSTIDFTPYQAKDEKNQVNGYVGLNASGQIDPSYINFDLSSLSNDIEYIYESFIYRGIGNVNTTTNALYSNFISNINTVTGSSPLFAVDYTTIGTTTIYKPYIRVLGSSVGGYLATYMGLSTSPPYTNFSYGTNLEITYKTTFSLSNYLADRSYSVGLGTPTQASGTLGGYGFYIRFSQNTNSGNIQLCQINNGVVTSTNTNTTVTLNTRYTLKIIFNSSTNIATFYLNGVSLGQLTISLLNKTLSPFYHIQSLSSVQATGSLLYINNIFMQIKYI